MSRDLTHRATGEGWEGILDPDESIVWQGRPDGRVVLNAGHFVGLIFGLFFAGFAAVWMMLAATAGGFFWTFGLIHFSVGLSIAFGSVFGPAWRRRHTWYTLTNHRAFIATDLPFKGRKLIAYPITPETQIKTTEDGTHSTIHFAQEFRTTKNGSTRVDIGFERIPEGREVLTLMRQTQSTERA